MFSRATSRSSRYICHIRVPLRPTPDFFYGQRFAPSISPFSTRKYSNPSTRSSTSKPSKTLESASTVLQAVSLMLNPPTSARPPPLTLPTRTPSQSTFSYFYALGKAYIIFYKSGIGAIYQNYKLSRALRARIAPASVDEALKRGALTRAEHQLLRRTSQDVRKIPLFVLMYLACGEFTPLVVVALSGVVPRTLWIPRQVRNARAKIGGRRARAFEARQSSPDSAAALPPVPPSTADTVAIGQILGAYPFWWDRLPVTPTWFIRRRVQQRLQEVELDDFAIERDGGVQWLEEEETRMAADTRGLDGAEDDAVLKEHLQSWLDARKERPVGSLILGGPSTWARG